MVVMFSFSSKCSKRQNDCRTLRSTQCSTAIGCKSYIGMMDSIVQEVGIMRLIACVLWWDTKNVSFQGVLPQRFCVVYFLALEL